MMTSLLLVDVQGFEALAKGQVDPVALISELSTKQDGGRQLAVIRAYCSNRVSSYRRTAYREAGFEIVETGGPDETLIRISVDLHTFAISPAAYEEAILLGGTTDYTGLARLAREHLMMVSVVNHATISSALEALADSLIELDDLEIDRSASIAPAPSFKTRERTPVEPLTPRTPFSSRSDKPDSKAADDKAKLDRPEEHKPDTESSDGDAWPDPKTGPILVAGAAAGAGAAALMSDAATAETSEEPSEAGTEDASDTAKAESSEAASDASTDGQADSKQADSKTETKAETETPSTEPAIDAELEDAIAESLSDDLGDSTDDDLSKSLGDDLDAELEAELTAELAPDLAAESADEASADEKNANEADKPAETNGAAHKAEHSDDDDSALDALFADIADGASDTTAVDPAVTAAPIDIPAMADEKADADVDELLSRLMSDDLAGDGTEPKKAELDVVPER